MLQKATSVLVPVVLVAAVFVLPSRVAVAGGVALSNPDPGYARSAPSQAKRAPVVYSAPGAGVSVRVSIPGQPAKAPVYVTLRGPDGTMRRFLVEGGREAIQSSQVVLRPGQSMTIRWVAAK
jgi:hypothetical protein